MLTLGRRYAHTPLGVLILLLVAATIAWLLERRVDGVRDAALFIAVPVPAAVAITPAPTETSPEVAAATAEEPALPAGAPAGPTNGGGLPAAVDPPPAALPEERYALESGPFTSAETADRLEDQLNRLGYATIRFRKHAATRLFVVAATGFASVQEARRAAAQIGRGAVVEVDGAPEVLVDRLPSLGEAITVARPLRARGFDVRVEEEVGPAVIYHIRYGQFGSQVAAQTRSDELAQVGVSSRVVKVR